MADVQIDDGNFTQIANVLLEKTSGSKMNGCQFSIVLMVWRYTYGFKRKEHELSSSFIAKNTGYNKRQIEREISKLVNRKIISQKVVNGVSRSLAFNKDFDTWSTTGELADGEKADGKYTDGELVPEPPARKPTVTTGELADQEIKSFKEIKQSIYSVLEHWKSLKIITPRKLSHVETQIKWKLGDYSEDDLKYAMSEYASILHDPNYILNTKWSLEEFLSKGHFEKFLPDRKPRDFYPKVKHARTTPVVIPSEPEPSEELKDQYADIIRRQQELRTRTGTTPY